MPRNRAIERECRSRRDRIRDLHDGDVSGGNRLVDVPFIDHEMVLDNPGVADFEEGSGLDFQRRRRKREIVVDLDNGSILDGGGDTDVATSPCQLLLGGDNMDDPDHPLDLIIPYSAIKFDFRIDSCVFGNLYLDRLERRQVHVDVPGVDGEGVAFDVAIGHDDDLARGDIDRMIGPAGVPHGIDLDWWKRFLAAIDLPGLERSRRDVRDQQEKECGQGDPPQCASMSRSRASSIHRYPPLDH